MIESRPRNNLILFSWVLLFASFYGLNQISQSGQNVALLSIYTFAFSAYLVLLFLAEKQSLRSLWLGTFVLYLLTFWQLPYLSNDYFRFLWDGEMMHLGMNPFDFTPNQLIHQKSFNDCYYLDLYAGMGELSQGNYSCYPSLNQVYFYLSTLFSNNLYINVLILRGLIILTLLYGVYHLRSLLRSLHWSEKRIFFLLLNPLVVLESFGNLHFELVTAALLIAALNLLHKQKYLFSALLFACAIQVKLIPLMLLPFLLPYLGWKKTLSYSVYVGTMVLAMFLVFLDLNNVSNFLSSLQLYFRQFEFNSFVLYPYLLHGQSKYGWNLTSLYAPKLAKWALVFIVGIAWNRRKIDFQEMLKRMFWGMMVYYFLTSTVHPWYWILPLFLSIFHFSWSILAASFFAIFSYGIYAFGIQSDYRQLLAVINVLIMMVFLLEIINPAAWKRFAPSLFQH